MTGDDGADRPKSEIRRMTPAEAKAAADRVTEREKADAPYWASLERSRIVTQEDLDVFIGGPGC